MKLFKSYEPIGTYPIEIYIGERLSTAILRSQEQGISINTVNSDLYDNLEDGDFTVDPSYNIRTDPFDLAEGYTKHKELVDFNRNRADSITPVTDPPTPVVETITESKS